MKILNLLLVVLVVFLTTNINAQQSITKRSSYQSKKINKILNQIDSLENELEDLKYELFLGNPAKNKAIIKRVYGNGGNHVGSEIIYNNDVKFLLIYIIDENGKWSDPITYKSGICYKDLEHNTILIKTNDGTLINSIRYYQ